MEKLKMVNMVKLNTFHFKIGDDVIAVNATDKEGAVRGLALQHADKFTKVGWAEYIGNDSSPIVKEELKELEEEKSLILAELEIKSKVFNILHDKDNKNNLDDAANEFGLFLTDNYNIYTIMEDNAKTPEIWIYEDGIYKPNGLARIKLIIRRIFGKYYNRGFINKLVERLIVDTYIEKDKFFLNEDPNFICLQNGIYDIKNEKLIKYNPKYKFFSKIPVEYYKNKKCPNIIKHFSEVLLSKDDLPLMQEIFGFCLYRDYKPEKSIMLLGSGRNGKGKSVELLRLFLGENNCSSIPIQDLDTNSFNLINLHNKLANIGADLSATALRETGIFKSLTGHDLINANRKGKSFISFVNYAKMIFCANQAPQVPDDTTAFWNRWVLLKFPYTFLSKSEIEKIDENKRQNLKVADINLIKKITTEDELSGLLNWALIGLKRLLKHGGFSTSKSADDVREEWIRNSDSVTAFCDDCLEEDFDFEEKREDIKLIYYRYCLDNKISVANDKRFIAKISQLLPTNLMRVRRGFKEDDTDNRVYIFPHIRIKPEIKNKYMEDLKK